MKKEKGITLIALVITIIVLLILAGVSISMVAGDNGIAKKAADAKEKTNAANADEEQKLQDALDYIDENVSGGVSGEPETPATVVGSVTFSKYITSPGCHEMAFWEHSDSCFTNEENTLTWEELKFEENGEKFGYEASYITDTEIGCVAFSNCSNLTSIDIPDSITKIDYNAFSNCDNLASIYIPDSVTSISWDAFASCDNLTSVTFGENSQLTSIGNSAFLSCPSLTIIIPDSVTSMGTSVFASSGLTSVTIGKGITSIGYAVFFNCTNLTEINYTGTVEQWNAITLDENWKDLVPATEVICSDGTVTL